MLPKVDERAVLKHFDWPEGKADALREAAFEYQDLVKLEKRVTSFVDDPKLSCEAALKKMYSLLEKYVCFYFFPSFPMHDIDACRALDML